MISFWNVVVGLLIAFLLGFAVRPLIERVKSSTELPPPSDDLKEEWKELTRGDPSGALLGHLERYAFFGAFSIDASAVIGAWLAFKVASKWNVWSNIISVPKSIDGIDEVKYLIARRRWGSQVLMSFLVGTLFNVMVGFIAATAGRHGYEIARHLCRLVSADAP